MDFSEFTSKANTQSKKVLRKAIPTIKKIGSLRPVQIIWLIVLVGVLLVSAVYFSVPGQLLYTIKSTVETQQVANMESGEQLRWLVDKQSQLLAAWETATTNSQCAEQILLWQELRKTWHQIITISLLNPDLEKTEIRFANLATTSSCNQEFYLPEYGILLSEAGFKISNNSKDQWQASLNSHLETAITRMQEISFDDQQTVNNITNLLISASELKDTTELIDLYKKYLLVNQALELEINAAATSENMSSPTKNYNFQALAWLSCQVEVSTNQECEQNTFAANWNSLVFSGEPNLNTINAGKQLYLDSYSLTSPE